MYKKLGAKNVWHSVHVVALSKVMLPYSQLFTLGGADPYVVMKMITRGEVYVQCYIGIPFPNR